jgi:class 3 adenylate cyclase/tetratricopeptide (TPR) repeat protein
MQVCPSCGEENPDRFRLCGFCGAQLAPDVKAPDVRKTVSVVFCDLKGSTTLGETLDTESLREVLNVYFNEMKAVLESHGGTVEKYIGDAIVAVFGLPRIHEDDALRAVRAAWEMKETLNDVNERLQAQWGVQLQNRTGVNTGEVVAGDVSAGQHLVTGDVVNTAARLEAAAPTMEILIGAPTYRLVKDFIETETVEPLELKGKAEPVPAYRLTCVPGLEQGEAIARRMDAPMVGRADELATLQESLARAIEGHRAELTTVIGSAGVGKSRLLQAFLERSADTARSLRGRCLSYGDGITFWPLAEIVREAAEIAADDALDVARAKLDALLGPELSNVTERIGAAIGLIDAAFPVEETFWAARRLLETLAAERPLIVLVDDIHWAVPTFLDLIRSVVDSTETPLAFVCSSRRELLEEHPDWADERDNARTIALEPLSEDESSEIVQNLLGSTSVDETARLKIITAAEGNPLYVEQVLSMLVDDGSVRQGADGRWELAPGLDSLTIPPSISALITARLDRLGATDRTVIEHGAVIGQVFFRGAIEDLAPEPMREHVGESLSSLGRKELIRQQETLFFGHETFRFIHILIKDAAYQGLLKRARAELHEAFVDWIERVSPERALEYEEISGYHLEQAYLIRIQLAPVDDHATGLGMRGAEYLSSAGHRALARGDLHAAGNLLQRAATLFPSGDRRRLSHLLEAGEAHIELGEFATAETLLTAAIEGAVERGDRALEATGKLILLDIRYTTTPEHIEEEIISEIEASIAELEELGDHEGLARGWRLLTLVHFEACRWGAGEDAARRMIDHARAAGNRILEARVLPALATSALYGPRPVPEAIAVCEELLEQTRIDRKGEAVTMRALAQLEAMRGDFQRARDLYRRSRASLEELGWKLHAASTATLSGPIELLAGDPRAAETELRRDYEALERMGDRYYRSTLAGLLAEALYQQARYDEAEEFAAKSREMAAPDDVSSQFLWRTVRAKVLAVGGNIPLAEDLAREAVEIIGKSEEPDAQAEALLGLAEVVMLAGRPDEAESTAREALALFTEKGNIVAAGRATAFLADVVRTASSVSPGSSPVPLDQPGTA